MKLRNIILAAAAVTMCSSAFAAGTGAIAQGGTYVGLAGGWGSISSESAADAANTIGYTTSLTTGGFSGRVYVGYLMPAMGSWLFGPEMGYSYYQNNTYNVPSNGLTVKQSGYGVDLLLNATYMITSTLNVAVKPGVQYGFEKFTFSDHSSYPDVNASRILPEINIETNWQAFANKPFFLGASYQYVFGDDATDSFDRANNGVGPVDSRSMLALNLEYLFN